MPPLGHWGLRSSAIGAFAAWSRALDRYIEELVGQGLRDTEGVGEKRAAHGTIEYARNTSRAFFAVRLTRASCVVEAFCLSLDGSELLLGQSLQSGELSKPAWWEASKEPLATVDDQVTKVPGFLHLAAFLLERDTLVSSAQLNEKVDEALLESQHNRDLANDLAEEVHRLNARLNSLLKGVPRGAGVEQATEPARNWSQETSLEDLATWAKLNAAKVEVLPRARTGAKKSRYEEPGYVYRALEFLAGPYHAYRSGTLDKTGMEAALAACGCQLAGSVSPSIAGEQGDAYFVRWGGRRRFMDLHLLRGGGREERFCMRIYFFWDDDSKKLVVGWLPSHLNNSLT